MYLVRVIHKPKHRYDYPRDWKVVSPTELATLTTDGPYWLEHLPQKAATVMVIIQDLINDTVQRRDS